MFHAKGEKSKFREGEEEAQNEGRGGDSEALTCLPASRVSFSLVDFMCVCVIDFSESTMSLEREKR